MDLASDNRFELGALHLTSAAAPAPFCVQTKGDREMKKQILAIVALLAASGLLGCGSEPSSSAVSQTPLFEMTIRIEEEMPQYPGNLQVKLLDSKGTVVAKAPYLGSSSTRIHFVRHDEEDLPGVALALEVGPVLPAGSRAGN